MITGDVEEVPVGVLDDQREPRLAGVLRVRFGHRAGGRRLPHRPVVGLAVVVAGQPEQQQERQGQRRVRAATSTSGRNCGQKSLASGAHAVAHARRVERRQVVVVRDEVVVPQERPHRRVDHERGEAEVGDQRRLPPPVGAQRALRDLGSRRREDAGAVAVGGGCAHRFPFICELSVRGDVRRVSANVATCRRGPRRRRPARSHWRTAVSGMPIFSPACWCVTYPALRFQFLGVDVEPVDIVENAFGVVDDASHRRGVAVA